MSYDTNKYTALKSNAYKIRYTCNQSEKNNADFDFER